MMIGLLLLLLSKMSSTKWFCVSFSQFPTKRRRWLFWLTKPLTIYDEETCEGLFGAKERDKLFFLESNYPKVWYNSLAFTCLGRVTKFIRLCHMKRRRSDKVPLQKACGLFLIDMEYKMNFAQFNQNSHDFSD
jgi:hypothetical protein